MHEYNFQMTALSAYLDEADDETTIEAAAGTPARGTLEELVLTKIQNMDDVELNALVEKFISSERIRDRFRESLENVKAVSEGRCEGMESSSAAMDVDETSARSHASGFHGRKWTELARFIPVRLTGSERRILALLDRSLRVSEYTDNVDIYVSRRERQASMESELEKFKSILSGQFIAMKMSRSTESLTEEWFQDVFEVGRRYKAMNPDSMRETYVKLMYMLQDSRSCSDFCEWSQKPIRTVGTVLEENEIEKTAFLSDPLLDEFVHANSKSALAALIDKFLVPPKSREHIELIAESIKDYCLLVNSFLDPVTQLLSFLNSFFTTNTGTCSLAIRSGENGSRLTHSHPRQFQYVTQSLRLWREVLLYFMPIWLKAEEDLLASSYRLADTGQGLNRVQGAPNCSRFMHTILDKVQRDLEGSWIGSSVVHMGDHTVPNALMFLDKYCQIPRILGPVAHTLRQLPKEYEKAPPVVREYIDCTFGGVVEAQTLICSDFFKHAFDGSGADNAYDAGSCIDGRLTSSWNWCGKIERKRYFPLFLLTNFVGFDGHHGW